MNFEDFLEYRPSQNNRVELIAGEIRTDRNLRGQLDVVDQYLRQLIRKKHLNLEIGNDYNYLVRSRVDTCRRVKLFIYQPQPYYQRTITGKEIIEHPPKVIADCYQKERAEEVSNLQQEYANFGVQEYWLFNVSSG